MLYHLGRFCFLFAVLFLTAAQLTAQYGIGTRNPNPSAVLDIVSKDKGLLIPRVSLTSSSTFAPILGTADQTHNGMLVYNTATTTLYGGGFYYWDWDEAKDSGLWRRFSTNGEIPYLIQDEDEDTHVAVDKNPGTDTDKISFTVSGIEQFKMVGGHRLEQSGNSGILIGKRRLDGSSVVFIGNRAGGDSNDDANSTGIGNEALRNNTTGIFNTAVGASALRNNISGFHNTAVGVDALKSNTKGSFNSALGVETFKSNTTGGLNSALGASALESNTTGFYNTAVGASALNFNTTGFRNTAVGYNALSGNKTGDRNVSIGHNSGVGIITGSRNVIVGNDVVNLPSDLSDTVIITNGVGKYRIVVDPKGNMGINSYSLTHSYTLTVNGSIGLEGGASELHPDYVFESYYDGVSEYNKDYKLMTLEEVEPFVKANKHLPGVQSRADIERNNGWNVSENVRVNLEKIEELYLHAIEQEKQIKTQRQELKIQRQLIEELSLRLEKKK